MSDDEVRALIAAQTVRIAVLEVRVEALEKRTTQTYSALAGVVATIIWAYASSVGLI